MAPKLQIIRSVCFLEAVKISRYVGMQDSALRLEML